MARWTEPTAEEESGWKEWVASRPDPVRLVAERFEPWALYKLKETGQRVTIYSFSEDGTLTVNITGEFNVVLFDRQVFGINPDELEPCDVPGDVDVCGALLTPEEVDENIDALRVMVRPDLFDMGPDGTAIRKG